MIDVFIKYPSIGCDAFATDTFGQGELHTIEFVLGCLKDAGLPGDRMVHSYGALEGSTLGYGSGLAREVLAKPNADGHDPWLEAIAVASVTGFPLIQELRQRLLDLDGTRVSAAPIHSPWNDDVPVDQLHHPAGLFGPDARRHQAGHGRHPRHEAKF
ncbi:hypothetical protein AAGW05_16050 [Arthrobacter sp. LAPM80]|uniref:hypothetical protein n=1 Tax=Arthrobacter sp. LAPM80 TaxID=3141788 RepID=UPI00398A6B9B